jgi:uncharacterized protein YceK
MLSMAGSARAHVLTLAVMLLLILDGCSSTAEAPTSAPSVVVDAGGQAALVEAGAWTE